MMQIEDSQEPKMSTTCKHSLEKFSFCIFRFSRVEFGDLADKENALNVGQVRKVTFVFSLHFVFFIVHLIFS